LTETLVRTNTGWSMRAPTCPSWCPNLRPAGCPGERMRTTLH